MQFSKKSKNRLTVSPASVVFFVGYAEKFMSIRALASSCTGIWKVRVGQTLRSFDGTPWIFNSLSAVCLIHRAILRLQNLQKAYSNQIRNPCGFQSGIAFVTKRKTMKKQWRKTWVAFALSLGLVLTSANSLQACWCSNGICSGWGTETGPLVGTVTSSDYVQVLQVTDQSNGSNPCNGSTAPTKNCSASGTATDVLDWSVSGSVNYSFFGVSAQVGGSHTQSSSCAGGAQISGWCTCCHEMAGLQFTTTTMSTQCYFDDGLCACINIYTGSCVKYDYGVCSDQPACVVPSGCTTGCSP
jgi:hypothetical protein